MKETLLLISGSCAAMCAAPEQPAGMVQIFPLPITLRDISSEGGETAGSLITVFKEKGQERPMKSTMGEMTILGERAVIDESGVDSMEMEKTYIYIH